MIMSKIKENTLAVTNGRLDMEAKKICELEHQQKLYKMKHGEK